MERKAAVAGQFYAGKRDTCISEIQQCLEARAAAKDLPENIVAGIVPHAGWTFSGDVAGMVFNAIKKVDGEVETFVIFGAAHYPIDRYAAVYNQGSWATPLGSIEIDQVLADAILTASASARESTEDHQSEHSIEVQVPFIQYLWPTAKIVPIMVEPAEFATDLGEDVAEVIASKFNGGRKIVVIGSTDLTHYGPRYGFDPMGVGAKAIGWAKDVNDKKFIDFALAMRAQQMLNTAVTNQNACGAGAAAATVAAAKKLGKKKGILLAHTHSNEVMEKKFGQTSEESVGYAGIVF